MKKTLDGNGHGKWIVVKFAKKLGSSVMLVLFFYFFIFSIFVVRGFRREIY